MESKTLFLVLLGFGVAAYVAYQLGKGAGESKPSQDAPAQPSPPPSSGLDEGGNLFPGLSGMDEATLCRLAPSVCAWRIPSPLPVRPML
jgi:hypothetical protein